MEADVYATVQIGFGEVNLYHRMDKVVSLIGESTTDNIRAFQAARIKFLEDCLKRHMDLIDAALQLEPSGPVWSHPRLSCVEVQVRPDSLAVFRKAVAEYE